MNHFKVRVLEFGAFLMETSWVGREELEYRLGYNKVPNVI
jgi:hypothetical protein